MKQIPLTQGKFALVNDEDFALVSQWKWSASLNDGRWYARRGPTADNPHKYLHRFITQAPRGSLVDHISGDGLDNRRSNLRLCTQSQNLANMRLPRKNTSGFKGVSYQPERKKWAAKVTIARKQIALGRFETKEEAARVYNAKALELFGPFARLNDL